MNIQQLEKLARRVVGRHVKVEFGSGAYTDGTTVTVIDPDARWPKLPASARKDIAEHLTAHEASHILLFDKVARKLGRPSVSAEEFYQMFADPLSPGADSTSFVRLLMNVVEDKLVDNTAGTFVGADTVERSNRYFIWNRQGGGRKPLAELESQGSGGKCAAFVEALFQIEIYGSLIESFASQPLVDAATEATRAIVAFGQGSLSRQQALQRVLDALRKYCPPPWKLPPEYEPPRGEGSGSGGDPTGQPGQGSGSGSGDGAGDGSGGEGDDGDDGDGHGQPGAQGCGEGSGDGSGEGAGEGAEGQGQGGGDKPGRKPSKGSNGKGGKPAAGEPGEEASQGPDSSGGDGSPSGGTSRGAGEGEGAGTPREIASDPERRFDDNNLEALIRMLERVLTERTEQTGRGRPRFRAWQPGDQVSSPEEICRYEEDDVYGVDPLKRRCVRRRDQEQHLIAVFIDSSGSVDDDLFAMLYRACGELAEKIGKAQGVKLGVGQFSGGACWVLAPTQNVTEIQEFADQVPQRLFSGGTTVGEIYQLLPEDFAGFETADLVVLTDGYVEDGKELARTLERAHAETGCEIKLHGVVFRGKGSLREFVRAKDELPEFVRTWHLGGD